MLLTINGQPHRTTAEPDTPLLDLLRNELGLKAAKFGCGEGECGACMVLVDGKAAPSCDRPIWSLDGKNVVTLEGLGTPARPHPIQRALLDEQAGQCGYCLAGVAVAAAALLQVNPEPTRSEIQAALQRNLCRCGSHQRIVRAVERAAAHLRGASLG